MRKILETKQPIVNGYPYYGMIFSLVNEDMWPWIHNNFIQVRHALGWGILIYDNHHLMLENCPFLNFYRLPSQYIKKHYEHSIVSATIEAINAGMYAHFYLDWFYLQDFNFYYKKEHHIHEAFAFGYDDERSTIMISDNFEEGNYHWIECSMNDVETAYLNVKPVIDYQKDLVLLEKKKNQWFHFDMKEVQTHVVNFLNSTPVIDLNQDQPCVTGMKALYSYKEQMIHTFETERLYEHRGLHFLYEYNHLMNLRLQYLEQYHFIESDEVLKSEFESLRYSFLQLRNMYLKYFLSHTLSMNVSYKRDNIMKNYQDNIEMEERLMTKLADKLQRVEG